MNKVLKLVCLILFIHYSFQTFGQDSTSALVSKDSIQLEVDSFSISTSYDSLLNDSIFIDSIKPKPTLIKNIPWQKDTAFTKLLHLTPLYKNKKLQTYPGKIRIVKKDDLLFYCLIFILLFLSISKAAFPRYFNNIFSLSFQATFRQMQTREQIAQSELPGFMLNLLFILSGGLFIALLAEYYKWSNLPLWHLFIYSSVILSLIYLTKFTFIQFAGWVFNAKTQAGEYSFVVFLVNKLIGILLVPFMFLIAYTDETLQKISVTLSVFSIVFLFLMRYIISMSRLRKNLHITAFHFFIYLCAVEIMPMLIVYKILFKQIGIN